MQYLSNVGLGGVYVCVEFVPLDWLSLSSSIFSFGLVRVRLSDRLLYFDWVWYFSLCDCCSEVCSECLYFVWGVCLSFCMLTVFISFWIYSLMKSFISGIISSMI